MPVTIHCPHCNAELQLKEENKGPEGLLECPKCKCTFRVCLATFNRECFAKIYPKTEWKADKDIQMEIGETLEKRKRGRPKKDKVEWQGGPMQEVPKEKEEKNAS